jgi:hypothetical protein
MAVIKRVLCPRRLRRVPSQFSWIDHRLVRDRHIARCSHQALALYLFLVTVCDGQGLSYYSDASIARLLRLDPAALARARRELIDARLIAHERPLYQVLALDDPDSAFADAPPTRDNPPAMSPHPARPSPRPAHPDSSPRPIAPLLSFGEVLRRILEHAK